MKAAVLFLCRAMGLFLLASRLTARQPRILCYHGISLEDEHRFRPGLFIRPEVFAARMKLLRKWKVRPVSLDELFSEIEARGDSNELRVAITIDDGWAGIAEGMLPELDRQGYPATLYLSTYFVEARRPVFKVAAAYLFWKYQRLFEPGENSCVRSVSSAPALDLQAVLAAAKSLGSEWEQPLLEELCDYFGATLSEWQDSGKFYFLAPSKVKALAQDGLAIELHTHRHRFSELSLEDARREIHDNRRAIFDMTGRSSTHFCFPRGEYRQEQLRILQEEGIQTATTTRNELVYPEDSPLQWPRIVDSDSISNLEFEAELTGFMGLLRRARQWSAG